VLDFTLSEMKNFLGEQKDYLVQGLAIFGILLVSLTAVLTLYLLRFPLRQMD
jgi:hypothetical protein